MQKFSKVLAIIALIMSVDSLASIPVNDDGSTIGSAKYTSRYESGIEMRKSRRVGIGLSAMGALGSAGTNLELNFTNKHGIMLGFGAGSPRFQSFGFQYKNVLTGDWLLPYFTLGYAHWGNYGEKKPINKTTPNFLQSKLMSSADKRSGKINENLIYPGFGLQFVKLQGDFAGSSIYIELLALTDLGEFVSVPTGSVGYLYYF